MTDLKPLVEDMMRATAWQRTPQEVTYGDYVNMIIGGLKHLYLITGRGDSYVDTMVDADAETFSADLNLTEKMIVLYASQIEFFEKVRADKNAIVGYTTDALSVTNADKPYQYLSQTIDELRQKIRVAYYKLVSYTVG